MDTASTQSDREHQLELRLRACLDSLQLAIEDRAGKGSRWADWTHPANSIRWAHAVLCSKHTKDGVGAAYSGDGYHRKRCMKEESG